MKSSIFQATGLKYQPVCLLWSDDKPDESMQFSSGKWGCVMWLVANAAKGRVSCCDRCSFGCTGGGVGLGFGNQYKNFMGGEHCFHYFLSSGNENWAKGKEMGAELKQYMQKEFHDNFMHGEGYIKSPDLVKEFVKNLPITEIPSKYVVFKPLELVDPGLENPKSVIFFADADQLSALVILANYARKSNESVIIPYAAGCHTLGIYPYRESESDNPRAVVGLTDISARAYIRNQLGDGLMTFTVPYSMYLEMESNVRGSFLERRAWKSLMNKSSE